MAREKSRFEILLGSGGGRVVEIFASMLPYCAGHSRQQYFPEIPVLNGIQDGGGQDGPYTVAGNQLRPRCH